MSFLEQLGNITDPKTRLDRYMEHQGGRKVYVDDPDLLVIFPDPIERHDRLEEWQRTHWKDSAPAGGAKPGVIVYGSILEDHANRILFEKRKRRRAYAEQKRKERAQWDSMFTEDGR